jgi:hypothetical protein
VSERSGEQEILILAPEGRDAIVLRTLLANAGIVFRIDVDGKSLLTAVEHG